MGASGLNVPQLSVAYRRLVLWFGAQLLVGLGGGIVSAMVGSSALGLAVAVVRLVGILISTIALVVYSYRTAVALGSGVGALWAVAMLVPLMNVVTLLVLSSKATRACRAAGVAVGFLGPKTTVPETQAEPR